jgi:proline iminopeptidase
MFITVNGARLFFDTVGSGLTLVGARMEPRPTLLVLHGGPGFDHSTLRPYFDRFADACHVVYIDHRGCGRSDGDRDSWHLDQWADDIAGFCAALGIEKPIVFGQSFGGMVAMHYAARHPDGPSKLILSSTAAQFRLDATEQMMRHLGGDEPAALARAFFTEPSPALFDAYNRVCMPYYAQSSDPDAAAFRARAIQRVEVAVHFFADEMKRMDMRAGIAAIPCPVLVMGGMQDPVTPPVCSEEIARAIGPNARLELFEACGHGAHRDHPEAAEKVMRAFLAA